MPRKRSESSIIETVIISRWPVAATACALSFIGGFLIIPHVLASNIFLAGLAPLVRTISLVAVVGLAAVTIFKFVREANANGPTTPSRDRRSAVQSPRQAFPASYPSASSDPIGAARTEPFVRARPTEWSLALLQAIEWKRFEEVVAAYFRAKNFRCETIDYGPDGGVDGRLYFGDLPDAVGVVQCKAWGNKQVGVAPVRELLGVMAHEKVSRGYFCATGEFSKEAVAFAATNPIKLISGRDLLDAIAQMPADARQRLLDVSTTGDYTTPTCPSCGIKLVDKAIGGRAAWACQNFPRCRVKIYRKSNQMAATVSAE